MLWHPISRARVDKHLLKTIFIIWRKSIKSQILIKFIKKFHLKQQSKIKRRQKST